MDKTVIKFDLISEVYTKIHAKIDNLASERKYNKDKMLELLETIIDRLRNSTQLWLWIFKDLLGLLADINFVIGRRKFSYPWL
jgi:hypothetical protein